jgi:hypothetical protein
MTCSVTGTCGAGGEHCQRGRERRHLPAAAHVPIISPGLPQPKAAWTPSRPRIPPPTVARAICGAFSQTAWLGFL